MGDFYAVAGRCIDKVIARKGTPKSIVFAEKFSKQTKLIYKLVMESLKYRSILEELLKKTSIEKDLKGIGKGRLLCLTYDFVIGDCLKNKKILKVFEKHKSALKNGLTMMKVKRKATCNEDLLPKEVTTHLPRYARVNLLAGKSIKDVLMELEKDFSILRPTADQFVEEALNMKSGEIVVDPVLIGLLAFHSSTNLADLFLNKEGHLIIQDRASSLPPLVLKPSVGETVLDCTAAPGNKTHQLATMVGRNGKVIACEADPKRYRLLSTRMKNLYAGDIVESRLQDYLKIETNTKPWSDCTKILLDPSCSGSGMSFRRLMQETDSKERIENLAKFQETALLKATTFPNVKMISYSTCSINDEENNQVVNKVLMQAKGWELANAHGHVKGFAKEEGMTISVAPFVSATNGFFVAILRKTIQ